MTCGTCDWHSVVGKAGKSLVQSYKDNRFKFNGLCERAAQINHHQDDVLEVGHNLLNSNLKVQCMGVDCSGMGTAVRGDSWHPEREGKKGLSSRRRTKFHSKTVSRLTAKVTFPLLQERLQQMDGIKAKSYKPAKT
ncbi:hypothetical protein BaRGS_00007158 [Batillaria attramentaria]|uniref:60S ribosomal protein L28 n=1 Tax=Batillaria attramentaria TaxID=370345 RepID=A0ABD0LQV1_9CAEN